MGNYFQLIKFLLLFYLIKSLSFLEINDPNLVAIYLYLHGTYANAHTSHLITFMEMFQSHRIEKNLPYHFQSALELNI